MQYSTWHHITEDGSDNSLRNFGYEVKFKHAVLLYMASHPRIWTQFFHPEDGSDNLLRNVGYEVQTCSNIIHGVASQNMDFVLSS
jgi:hypothetical protein